MTRRKNFDGNSDVAVLPTTVVIYGIHIFENLGEAKR
jgi:hypothetical protein